MMYWKEVQSGQIWGSRREQTGEGQTPIESTDAAGEGLTAATALSKCRLGRSRRGGRWRLGEERVRKRGCRTRSDANRACYVDLGP